MTSHHASTTAKEFDSLPVRDAVLHQLRVDWAHATCTAEMEAFIDPRQTAVARHLIWRGVRELQVPHRSPWGESTHINSARFKSPDVFIIEMQSGDEIRIVANAFEFAPP
jgi:hypothetical protein